MSEEAPYLARLCEQLLQRNEELIEENARLKALATQKAASEHEEEDYWTIKEAADALNLSTKALYDAWSSKLLPGAIKVGGSIRIHRPTLLASGAALRMTRGRQRRKGA